MSRLWVLRVVLNNPAQMGLRSRNVSLRQLQVGQRHSCFQMRRITLQEAFQKAFATTNVTVIPSCYGGLQHGIVTALLKQLGSTRIDRRRLLGFFLLNFWCRASQ